VTLRRGKRLAAETTVTVAAARQPKVRVRLHPRRRLAAGTYVLDISNGKQRLVHERVEVKG
jgi:hypothetical protein